MSLMVQSEPFPIYSIAPTLWLGVTMEAPFFPWDRRPIFGMLLLAQRIEAYKSMEALSRQWTGTPQLKPR